MSKHYEVRSSIAYPGMWRIVELGGLWHWLFGYSDVDVAPIESFEEAVKIATALNEMRRKKSA